MAGVGNSGGGGGGGNVRAGRAFVELYAKDSGVLRALDKIKARANAFAGVTARAGAALGSAGVAGLAPVLSAVSTLREQSDTLATATALGIDPEKASRLFGILKAGGSDLRDAAEGIAQFGGRIEDALTGKGEEAAELFAKLGVSAAEFVGLDAADQMYKLMDAIKGGVDPADHLRVLMKAVGEDTGKNMMKVLSLSADEMARLGDASGMTREDLEAAKRASLEYTIASAGISRAWGAVVAALAPAITDLARLVQDGARAVAEFLRENKGVVTTAAAVAAGLAATGAALVAVAAAAKAAATAVGLLSSAVSLLVKGVALLATPGGAVFGLGAVLVSQSESGRRAFSALSETLTTVGATFKETWGGILSAASKGDLELAFRVAGKGIEVAWRQMLAGMAKAFNDFVRANREVLTALAAVAGGVKVGKLGMRLGPAGGAIGATLGAAGAAVAADEALEALLRASDPTGLDAAAKRAQAELKALLATAAAPAVTAGAPGSDADKYLTYKQRTDPARFQVGASGSFTAAQAAQRFGFSDSVPVKQLAQQRRIAVATEATAAGIAIIQGALNFR